MSPSFFLRAFASLLFVAGAVGGCQSDVERRVALAGLSSTCRINSDCNDLLLCVFELCHEQCENSRDCPRGARCVSTDQGRNVCQLPEEAACSAASSCQSSQVCGSDGQCRDGCRSDADCVTDQECSAGTCADATELTNEGRLPVTADDPPAYLPCAFDSDCPEALVCQAGACRVECTENEDCDSGERCTEGLCTKAPAPAGSCLRNSDCEPGLVCAAGWCQKSTAPSEPECEYDSDCEAQGQHCVEGACRCECASDTDCASGFACQGACSCEPARVIRGDVSITNDRELAALRDVVEITGQLMVQINRQGTFHVPSLRRAGAVLVSNPGAGFVFDSLEEVSGNINCYQDCVMPALRSAGDVSLTSFLSGETAFPQLKTTGNFYFYNSARLTHVRLPELTSALDLHVLGNQALVELSAPKLQSLTSLVIQNGAALRRVSLPLAAPTSKVELSAAPFLETLELPQVQSLTAWLTISNCAGLRHARFPRLDFVEQLQLDRMPQLTEVDLSSLREVPSGAQLNELGTAPGFPVSLPALQSAGPFVIASGHVSAFSAPNATLLDSLTLNGLPSLKALDLRKLEQIGALDVNGTYLPDVLTLTQPPVGIGALESASTVSFTNNPALPVCALNELDASLGAGLAGELSQYGNVSCPCNGASCQ